MKKFLQNKLNWSMAIMLVTTLIAGLAGASAHTMADGSAHAELHIESDLDIVSELNMLVGEGDGLTDTYLSKPTTRIQAAIMFLRLKGLDGSATAFTGTENYADADQVGASNRPIMAYLKAHPELGWVGVGDNKFDPLGHLTAQQYYKVMLEALGYQTGTDFEYKDTLTFAASKGLSELAGAGHIVNRHIATATVEALKAEVKESGQTLAEQLVQSQVIKEEKVAALDFQRVKVMTNAELGAYLTDGQGMTLYLFTKDEADKNSCTGQCLVNWPIFYSEHLQIPAELDGADFGVFIRADGQKHLTYKGWPLYYFIKDKQPGDVTGEGVGNVWFTMDPAGFTPPVSETEQGDTGATPAPAQPAEPKTYTVDIKEFKFTPAELTVEAGSKITFVNHDEAEHNAVAVDGSFSTPLLEKGESHTITIGEAGEYDYFCEPHKNFMKATIIVK